MSTSWEPAKQWRRGVQLMSAKEMVEFEEPAMELRRLNREPAPGGRAPVVLARPCLTDACS